MKKHLVRRHIITKIEESVYQIVRDEIEKQLIIIKIEKSKMKHFLKMENLLKKGFIMKAEI